MNDNLQEELFGWLLQSTISMTAKKTKIIVIEVQMHQNQGPLETEWKQKHLHSL